MDTTTINGLHKCQPKNAPVEGEVKNMVVLHMPAQGTKKAYIKIKNELPEKGGTPHRILTVQPLDWPPDQYKNIAFNLEVEPSSSQPTTTFQNARQTMQQGRVPSETQQGTQREDFLHQPDSDWPDAEIVTEPTGTAKEKIAVDHGVNEARRHLMQSANLYNLCVAAVDKAIAPNMPQIAQTSEMFQAAVASLYIEASKDVWWSGKIVKESWINSMPTVPIK